MRSFFVILVLSAAFPLAVHAEVEKVTITARTVVADGMRLVQPDRTKSSSVASSSRSIPPILTTARLSIWNTRRAAATAWSISRLI
jgi:hypothetical protein